ncbi:MAG: glycosyltransferase [Candidatus Azobacteroides sp.]|nr:glycosyltransferase [Candidatus Azobacteroides sp.]
MLVSRNNQQRKPKISVIIPVYNTETFVKESLLSIANQTINAIEIIAIDDGSTDNSLQILNDMAKIDNRIRVYSQIHKGTSCARNLGMDQASGDYVYFMDSDDLLDKNALRLCYEKCEADHLDFVFFDAISFTENSDFIENDYYRRTVLLENEIGTGVDWLNLLLKSQAYKCSPCLNLINRDFLNENKIRFYPGILYEDQLFTPQIYFPARRVGYIPQRFYRRRIRNGSTMTSPFSTVNLSSCLIILREMKKQKVDQSSGKIRDRLISNMLHYTLEKSRIFPFRMRCKIIGLSLRSYFKYIRIRDLISIILLQKCSI